MLALSTRPAEVVVSRARISEKTKDSNKKAPVRDEPRHRLPARAARVLSVDARRRPRQERSRAMVEAIERAAAEMFAEHGYARTSTNKIAERAGVSVGSLYQYFPNKDSVLSRLWRRHHEQVHAVVEVGMTRLADPSVPLEAGIRWLLVELLALHRRDPALTRALSATVIRESPAVERKHQELNARADATALAALLAARPDVRAGDHLAMAVVLAQTTAQLTRWLVHDAPAGIDPEALLEETVQLMTRFVTKSPVVPL